MQKIYCLTLAAVTSLSVAAAPKSSVMKDLSAPLRIKQSINTNTKKLAPAKISDETSWGEWQMEGTGTFTIDNGFEDFLGLPDWKGDYEGINVYSRTNSDNAASMQYKFEGIFNEADIIVDYDSNTGLCRVMPQPTNIDAYGMPLDVVDCATVFELYGAEWQGMTPEEVQEIVDMYAQYTYFVPELGKFYLYLGYITDGIEDLVCLTDCSMQLDGVEDMSVSVEADTFYNDASEMKALIKFPSNVASCRYGCFEGMMTQAHINAILNNAEGVNTLTKTTAIDLDCTAGPGMYSVVAVTFSENGTPLEWDYAEFTYTPSSREGWTSLGKGKFTSDMFESLFDLSAPTYEVEVERNNANPALIRIVNPYNIDYPYTEELEAITVDGFDLFVVFDTTDPAKVFFKPTNLGIDFGGGWWTSMTYGYFVEAINGKVASDNSFGKLENGVITFPPKSVLTTCPNISALGGQDGSWYYGNGSGSMSLTIPVSTAVESVATAHNSECEYFNMQGIKIAAPEKGTMVIERSGNSVIKKLIR